MMRWLLRTALHLSLLSGVLAAQRPQQGATPSSAAPARVSAPVDTAVAARAVGLGLLGISDGKRVILRWAPGSAAVWQAGNRYGYVVERMRTTGAAAQGTAFEKLSTEPLRPWPLPVWGERSGATNQWGAIAAQMLHGEVEVPTDKTRPFAELRDRADLLRNRHGFALLAADMDSTAATGLALRYEDARVESGVEYLYRVYVARPVGDTSAALREMVGVDTAYALVRVAPLGRVPGPPALRALAGDGQIGLTWERDPLLTFSAYHVERSDDGGKSFRRLSDAPVLTMDNAPADAPLFVDSAAVNGRSYRYRVIGITPFATLSESAEVDGVARDLTPPPSPLLQGAEVVRESTVQLRWKYDAPPRDLAGFRVGIARDPDGPFDVDSGAPLPPSAREALDSRGVSGIPNYYTILAIDSAGNVSHAMPVAVHPVDSVPPAAPTGLAAKVDSTGRLLITWARGAEPDLLGWRVYRLNQEDHVPVLQTGDPRIFPYFEDSIPVRTLTRALYYDVVALDRSHNPSASARVRVMLPDVVPPVAPLLRAATPSENAVALLWVRSPSTDVQRQLVLRRVAGDSAWSELVALSTADSAYADQAVQSGRSYQYTLVAIDSAGLRSDPGTPLSARPYGQALRPGVTDLRVAARDGAAHLAWSDPAPAGAEHWFVIYRAAGDAPLARYASSNAPSFVDRGVTPGTTYRYAVQLLYRDGGRTRQSEPRAITPER